MPVLNQVVFSDLDIAFNIHPIKKTVNVLKNNDAVVRAVKNILLTNKFERPYQPLVGSDIRYRLFENFDSITAHTIKKDIQYALRNYEPRVKVLTVRVDEDIDGNGVYVFLRLQVVNQTEPLEVTFFIERIR